MQRHLNHTGTEICVYFTKTVKSNQSKIAVLFVSNTLLFTLAWTELYGSCLLLLLGSSGPYVHVSIQWMLNDKMLHRLLKLFQCCILDEL